MVPPSRTTFFDVQRFLESGDIATLEKFTALDPSFPAGTDPDGVPWIVHAVNYGSASVVEWMLDKGANVNAGKSPGFTGITEVFERDLPERRAILEVLIRRGADLNARGQNHWTPVFLAGN